MHRTRKLHLTAAAVAAALFACQQAATAQGAETIQVEKARVAPGEPIVVTTACPTATSSAWIGLFKAGAKSQSYQTYAYVSSGENCRVEFADGLDDLGAYDARLFPDSGYGDIARVAFEVANGPPKEAAQAEVSEEALPSPFPAPGTTVTSATPAATQVAHAGADDAAGHVTGSGLVFDKQRYGVGEKIRVTFDCSGQDPHAWIGIFKPQDSTRDYGTHGQDWLYFRDRKNCNFVFNGRSFAGDYEVRIIPAHGDFIETRQGFSVVDGAGAGNGAAGGISFAKAAFTTNEPIVVTAPCVTGDLEQSAWIALYKSGASSHSYGQKQQDWFYMKEGERSGANCTFRFAGRKDRGQYEVRMFHDNRYQAFAQRGFEITKTGVKQQVAAKPKPAGNPPKGLWVALSKTNYAPGEPITVAIQCHAREYPARDPWIGLRPANEAAHSHPQRSAAGRFQQDWYYLKNFTQPGGECVYQFAGRSEPGRYQVRVFRTIEDCDCAENLSSVVEFTVGGPQSAARPRKQDFSLTEAANRYKQYDYVKDAHSNECIKMSGDQQRFANDCDFPVQVYLSRKLGYDDRPMQFAALAPKSGLPLEFDARGTLSWMACHESQGLCMRALDCMHDLAASGQSVMGYVNGHCSAFEK